ncbi:unnamed protein product [Rotaria sp. Silwood1]|nr:unnamed protein product [Rotaria sp. Silwood1]
MMYEQENHFQLLDKQDYKQMYISYIAMKFAVEDRFPSLKIKWEPALESRNDASLIAKELLNHIEKKLSKMEFSL